jgi:hypothetical protein
MYNSNCPVLINVLYVLGPSQASHLIIQKNCIKIGTENEVNLHVSFLRRLNLKAVVITEL